MHQSIPSTKLNRLRLYTEIVKKDSRKSMLSLAHEWSHSGWTFGINTSITHGGIQVNPT